MALVGCAFPFHPSALDGGEVRNRKWEPGKGWGRELEVAMCQDLERHGWHVPDMEAWTRGAAGYLPTARYLRVEEQANPRGYVLRCFRQQGLEVAEENGRITLRDPAWFDFGVQPGLPF